MANSISRVILGRPDDHEKNAATPGSDLTASVAALHLTPSGLRGTVRLRKPVDLRMRNLATALKRQDLARIALVSCLALSTFGQPAHAANPLELNFGLFGPGWEGRVAPCEKALSTITEQFREKESNYWNSALRITAYGNIHEIAFRPWQSDNIPRRYCSGSAMTSDGKVHTVNFSIIEDGGFSGYGQGVEWCLTGLDRNWAYNPACKAAGP
jgi:hypothetical protein